MTVNGADSVGQSPDHARFLRVLHGDLPTVGGLHDMRLKPQTQPQRRLRVWLHFASSVLVLPLEPVGPMHPGPRLLILNHLTPTRRSLNVVPRNTEGFVLLVGILKFSFTLLVVGDSD